MLVLSTNSDEAGAPRHAETLVRSLHSRVSFTIVFGADGPVFRRMLDAGFDARLVEGMRSKISPIADIRSLIEIVQVIKDVNPDVIHCHSSKAGLLGRIAGFVTHVPVIFTVHGWSWNSLPGFAKALPMAVELLAARFKGCFYVYVSEAVRANGEKRLFLNSNTGAVVLNGVPDLGLGAPPRDGPVKFIMPARAAYPKDHETLVRAFEQLDEATSLSLAGEGTDCVAFREQLKVWAPKRHQDIATLGLRADIADLLKSSHVMVLSSRSEAMPLSILEAMSCGLPVIASEVGGTKEQIVHGSTGLLVPAGVVSELAGAMRNLSNQSVRLRLGSAARLRYEQNFTVAGMSENMLRLYKQAQKRHL